jgi:hypothetical protein
MLVCADGGRHIIICSLARMEELGLIGVCLEKKKKKNKNDDAAAGGGRVVLEDEDYRQQQQGHHQFIIMDSKDGY